MLRIENLSVENRLHAICVEQAFGNVIHLVGQNGAGKSSLLSAIAGVLTINHGAVWVNDISISDIDEASFAAFRAFLEQHYDTPFNLPVEQVLRYFGQGQAQEVVLPNMLNDALEINELLTRPITRLSGGERQRVHIARALLKAWNMLEEGNGLVLLDEPFQGLDYRHQRLLCSFLSALARKGNGIVVSVHDINLSVAYADKVWLMHDGRLVLNGDTNEVLTHANLTQYWNVELQQAKTTTGQQYFHIKP